MPTAPLRYQVGTGTSAITFTGIPFPIRMHNAIPPKVATGYDVSRDSRTDTFALRHDDWSGGILATSGIYSVREKNRWFKNEGLVATRPGQLVLPFVSTNQAALDNIDISGFRAANKRVHSIMAWHGVSGMRNLLALGTKVYIDTSLSDPSLTLSDDTLTDTVLSVANLKLNAVDYCTVSTDGQTNDTRGATDVTGANPFTGGTELVTHANGADGFFAMDYFGNLRWNVFIGVLNNVNGVWAYPDKAVTLPLTSSTMLPVVYTGSKDVLDANAVEYSLTNLDPTTSSNEGIGSGFAVLSPVIIWTDVGNIFSSNDTDAAFNASVAGTALAGENFTTSWLHAGGFATTTIPLSARLTELIATIEHAEGDADMNAYLSEVQLIVNGEQVGTPRSAGDELGTADSTDTVGAAADDWGTGGQLKGSSIRGIGLRMRYSGTATGNVTAPGAVTVDHVRITSLKYKIPGKQISLPKGGYSPGKPPHKAGLLAYIHPVTDEETTIVKPRIVTYIQFEDDPEGERLTAEISQPPIQMPNVVDFDWFQGGGAVAGGAPGALATQAKLIDQNNVTRDLGFPAVHGTTAVRIAALFARGAFLMAWVSDNASTDCQLWYYFNGAWHIYGALFSKTLGGAMSTQPLNWAEKTLNTHQSYIYCIYPTSTNTSALRQFVPPDLINADPFLVNTSIVKQDGPLYIQGVEIESLPSEANNAILSLYMQSRQVDNNTSYGSVNVKIDTGGDTAFSSAEVDQTFDAAAETFSERNIASTGDPGVAFKTTITRVTLNHEASSTETPNGCTVQINCTSDWDPKYEFGIMLIDRRPRVADDWFVPMQQYPTPYALLDKIHTQIKSKVSQELTEVGVGTALRKSIKHQPWTLSWRKDMSPGSWDAVEFLALNYLENVGGLS